MSSLDIPGRHQGPGCLEIRAGRRLAGGGVVGRIRQWRGRCRGVGGHHRLCGGLGRLFTRARERKSKQGQGHDHRRSTRTAKLVPFSAQVHAGSTGCCDRTYRRGAALAAGNTGDRPAIDPRTDTSVPFVSFLELTVTTARLSLFLGRGAEPVGWPTRVEPSSNAQADAGSGPARIDWNQLIARHDRRVFASLLAIGLPVDEAREVAQETWLRLVEQHRHGQLAQLSLPGLAIRQARFLAADRRRKAQRRDVLARQHAATQGVAITPSDERPAGSTDDEAERRLDARADLQVIADVVSRCGPTARAVFRGLFGPQSRSPAELAVELGISVQRVRQIACELRRTIRQRLEDPQ
ncbi:MAG: sigma-70 family RNA polymerase sigma factor [Myxococcales bacterium FL481]|nr:MAG: sigma-70 family RNA polymerase sigma factor [Myxococcales bacterium FL481]